MFFAALAFAALALAQQPASAPAPAPAQDVPVLKAGLGPCSAEFTVKDSDGKPSYLATVHTRIRYGAMSIKRMDLEVSTNADGKARLDSLPAKARPVAYDIQQGDKKATAEQTVSSNCHAVFEIALK